MSILDGVNLERLLLPEGEPTPLSIDGFLEDQVLWGESPLVDVAAIDAVPCVIVLAPPGMGKSHFLTSLATKSQNAVFFDLGTLGDRQELHEDLFESERLADWRAGDGTLDLVLDGLDEGGLVVKRLHQALARELRREDTQRLRLRIACREAVWPEELTGALERLWGKDSVVKYRLAPLRRNDVRAAASAIGAEPDQFLAAVEARGVGPLAARPLTLAMLLAAFFDSGSELPQTRAGLYKSGLTQLAAENNERRRFEGPLPDEASRLRVCKHLAYLSVFSNRLLVSAAVDPAPTELPIAAAVDENQQVGREDLLDALRSSIFVSHGAERYRWAHHSYAEYLAAHGLLEAGAREELLRDLLCHPADDRGRVMPQLREVAAWLADGNPRNWRFIGGMDPEALLRGDPTAWPDGYAASLVETLLERRADGSIPEGGESLARFYGRLEHAGLADQLRPYLEAEASTDPGTLRVVFEIFEECGVGDLCPEVANIALDSKRDLRSRVRAAYALVRVGATESLAQLAPLLDVDPTIDQNEDLKGLALRALWPKHLTANDLFGLLTPPRRTSYFGAYKGFLSGDLVEGLSNEDLPAALSWVKALGDGAQSLALHQPIEQILARAAQEASTEDDWKRLFAVLRRLDRWSHHRSSTRESDDTIEKVLTNREGASASLLRAALESADEELPFRWGPWRVLLYRPENLPSALAWAVDGDFPREMMKGAVLACLDAGEPEQVSEVLRAMDASEAVAEDFADLLAYGESAEQIAEAIRHGRAARQATTAEPEELIEPPPAARVATRLEQIEAGRHDLWWDLLKQLTLTPTSTHYRDLRGLHVLDMPGWHSADEATRHRVVNAATRYLESADPAADEWAGTNTIAAKAYGGLRALELICGIGQSESVSKEHWSRWAIAVVGNSGRWGEQAVAKSLAEELVNRAPDATVEAWRLILDGEDLSQSTSMVVFRRMRWYWHPAMAEMLTALVDQPDVHVDVVAAVLTTLHEHAAEAALPILRELVGRHVVGSEPSEVSVAAARILLEHDPDAWAVVRSVLDMAFAKRVFAVMWLGMRDESAFVLRMRDRDLAEMYLALVWSFPPSEGEWDGPHWIGPEQQAEMLRDHSLRVLRDRGTWEAVSGIRKIQQTLPEFRWLRTTVAAAEENARRRAWAPPTPTSLVKLLGSPRSRLVESPDVLLQLIVDSIGRWEAHLRGQQAPLWSLWNNPKGVCTPKDENHLSNSLAVWLRQDLTAAAVVNREVEVRPGVGGSAGQRTDILVEATAADAASDVLRVVLEVKGVWNSELETALRGQLVERYLQNHGTNHGIYVVGWFNCLAWDSGDYRRAVAFRRDLEDTRNLLNTQAQEASTSGVGVSAVVIELGLS